MLPLQGKFNILLAEWRPPCLLKFSNRFSTIFIFCFLPLIIRIANRTAVVFHYFLQYIYIYIPSFELTKCQIINIGSEHWYVWTGTSAILKLSEVGIHGISLCRTCLYNKMNNTSHFSKHKKIVLSIMFRRLLIQLQLQ